MRLALINPNTNAATTHGMCEIARTLVRPGTVIEGITAPFGTGLITSEDALRVAADAVESLAEGLGGYDGVIVSAFGDPGLQALRARLACGVTGIAEAAMAAAAAFGRFAVVTTTPDLVAAITSRAHAYGHGGAFLGVCLTPGDPAWVMQRGDQLVAALATACDEACRLGAEAIIIGGGPLARAAAALQGRIGAALIQPVIEAVALAERRASGEGDWA